MKFLNFINENRTEEISTIEDFIERVKSDCKPFLKDFRTSDEFLFSGRKKYPDLFYSIPRKDRLPKDNTKEFHDLLNEIFYNKFKVKIRSNGIFCGLTHQQTSEYGEPYIIFPIGEYSLYWSEHIWDIYDEAWQQTHKPGKKPDDQIINLVLSYLADKRRDTSSFADWYEGFFNIEKPMSENEIERKMKYYKKNAKIHYEQFGNLYKKTSFKTYSEKRGNAVECTLICDGFYGAKNKIFKNDIKMELRW